MSDSRVTQVTLEVEATAEAEARVTQAVLGVEATADVLSRVTQVLFCVELVFPMIEGPAAQWF